MPKVNIEKYFELLQKKQLFDRIKSNLIVQFNQMDSLLQEIQNHSTYEEIFMDNEKTELSDFRQKGNQIKLLLGESQNENIGN